MPHILKTLIKCSNEIKKKKKMQNDDPFAKIICKYKFTDAIRNSAYMHTRVRHFF